MSTYVKTSSGPSLITNSTEIVNRSIENTNYNLILYIMKYGKIVNYRISSYISIALTAGKTYSPFRPADTIPIYRRYYTLYQNPSLAFDFVIDLDGTVSIIPAVTIAKGSPINIDVVFLQA